MILAPAGQVPSAVAPVSPSGAPSHLNRRYMPMLELTLWPLKLKRGRDDTNCARREASDGHVTRRLAGGCAGEPLRRRRTFEMALSSSWQALQLTCSASLQVAATAQLRPRARASTLRKLRQRGAAA